MDNITHSIIGLGVGELLHRSLPPEPDAGRHGTRHRLLLVSCAVASNLPDLDLFLTRLLPDPLGYLLNHRGHTHTLLFAVPQALMLAALLWLFWPAARALLRASAPARWGLAASVLGGLGLHLLMDYTNSYGLHPFYPLDQRWFYGDMVFIVEPLFWVAFGVPLALMMPARAARVITLAVLAAALSFFAWRSYLGGVSFAVLLMLGAVLAMAQRRSGLRGRGALWLALAISVGFIAAQGEASALGRARISAALQRIDPASRVLDVAMTAFPSQPLCWSFVSVENNEAAGSYRLRRGVSSLAPHWLAPLACPNGLVEQKLSSPLAPDIAQFDDTTASLQTLRALKNDNCYVDAWLRFARAPALMGGALSDYRFAATPRGNFSTLRIADFEHEGCPSGVPAWGYPRADLLTPAAAR